MAEYHDFPSKSCCLMVPKYFVGGTFLVSDKIWNRKKSKLREGLARFSVGYFLSHSNQLFRRATFLCCVSIIFRWRKSSWIRWGEGVSRLSVENLLCHSTEKFRRGTLPDLRKFLVSKKFMDMRGEGCDGITIFR